ncbi:helix-turn-helix domain-containing protein [Natrarchaeobius oligotrophus]|uniref:Bacterio-opsin activator n=1 Tax=Natrarchaeobius chitinivorans TaxID=1679083 RepID=A0A3N6MUF7_NATCH|nr:helix-turn-helix domain-containing protein [Natrarchaeobius chitinivorans]RQG98476.1 bacterio-opsin activator [Natrarchaeobius chitinivorans]
MSVIATVAIPAAEFPLGSLLEPDTNATVTVETTVPTSEDVIPYLWIPDDGADEILERLEAEPSVTSVSVVDAMDDHVLVKIGWKQQINGVLESVEQSDAIVTSAAGTHDRWTFRLRFPSYEDLSTFYTDCLERDVSIELIQLHEAISPDSELRFGLTAAQRKLIVAAYEAGYFDVPRRTTLVELGERLDVSDSAVSQRLRRGLATLINSTIVVGTGTDDSAAEGRSPNPGLNAGADGRDDR